MPCILRWPGRVPAGTECQELCTMMDFLPTLAKLAGAPLPAKVIDGRKSRRVYVPGGSGVLPAVNSIGSRGSVVEGRLVVVGSSVGAKVTVARP